MLKTGNKKEALAKSAEVYKNALRLLGEKHVTTISALSIMAIAKMENNEFKSGFQHIKKAYAMAKEQLGNEHRRTKEIEKHYKKAKIKAIFRILYEFRGIIGLK